MPPTKAAVTLLDMPGSVLDAISATLGDRDVLTLACAHRSLSGPLQERRERLTDELWELMQDLSDALLTDHDRQWVEAVREEYPSAPDGMDVRAKLQAKKKHACLHMWFPSCKPCREQRVSQLKAAGFFEHFNFTKYTHHFKAQVSICDRAWGRGFAGSGIA